MHLSHRSNQVLKVILTLFTAIHLHSKIDLYLFYKPKVIYLQWFIEWWNYSVIWTKEIPIPINALHKNCNFLNLEDIVMKQQ